MLYGTLLIGLLLAGCTEEAYTKEDIKQAASMGTDPVSVHTYMLDVVQEGDAFALIERDDAIWSYYFETINSGLVGDEGYSTVCNSEVNWDVLGGSIVTGMVCDSDIEKVTINGSSAEFILEEGVRRYWYAVVPEDVEAEQADVVYHNQDGTEETIPSYSPSETEE